jgi:hypothetical protein
MIYSYDLVQLVGKSGNLNLTNSIVAGSTSADNGTRNLFTVNCNNVTVKLLRRSTP